MKKQVLFLAVFLLSLTGIHAQTNGLSFDGTNDYVTCGNILTASYTKEAWVMVNNYGPQNNFISGGGNGQHALWCPNTNASKLSAGHNGSWTQVQDAVSLVLGTWYHVAVTYDAATTTMNLYKNGVLISTNASVPAYTGGTFVQLGSYAGQANLLNGSLDEVRIWNYARTGSDILNNMNCELNGPQVGLIAYYQFNQGVAAANNTGINTLTDISGNNNTGTMNNFALTGATSNWIVGSPVGTIPNVTASVSNSVICLGDQTTLSGGGAATYVWTGSVTDAVAFSPTITDTYTVIGTTASGCSNTAVQTVSVNNLPSVTASVTNSVICLGNQTTLSGGGAVTYTWTGSVTDAVAFAPTTTDTYTVTGTDANGCSNTAVQSITVNSLPSISVNVTNTAVCLGGQTTLSGNGALTYTWTGSVTDAVAFAPTITDTYTVTGTDANGCMNTAMQTVVVNNLPAVSAVTNNSIICVGQTATLTASGAATYSWNTTATTTVISVTPTANTSYTVTGFDANGCNSTFVVTQSVSVCTGISSNVNNVGFNIYPNPTNGILNIESNTDLNLIEVIDPTGRVVLSESSKNSNKIILNMASLKNAIYLVRLTNTNGEVNQTRVVIQK